MSRVHEGSQNGYSSARILFPIFHEALQIRVLALASHEEMNVIGHEAVRDYSKSLFARRTQELIADERNMVVGRKVKLARVQKVRKYRWAPR